jgi:hypothetical protein
MPLAAMLPTVRHQERGFTMNAEESVDCIAERDRFDGNCFGTKGSHSQADDQRFTGRGEREQLLLLMDTDKNGKLSKQEWMKFMDTEFDTLDKDKKGQLDETRSAFRLGQVISSFKRGGAIVWLRQL